MSWGVPTAKAKGTSNYYVIVIQDQTVSIWHFSLLQDPGAVDFMLKASSYRVEGGSALSVNMLLKLLRSSKEIGLHPGRVWFNWDFLLLLELEDSKKKRSSTSAWTPLHREQQLLGNGGFREFRSPTKQTVTWLLQFKSKDPNFGTLRVDNFNPRDSSF